MCTLAVNPTLQLIAYWVLCVLYDVNNEWMVPMPLVLFWTLPVDGWWRSCHVVSHLERCVCVFEGFNVYITFGRPLKSSHELSSLLYLCSKRNVILSASEENTLNYTETFSVWSTFFQSQKLQLVVGNVYFCALYMLRNFILKKMKFNVHNKTSPYEATLSRVRKTVWEVHIYHCYIKIYILIIFAGFASKLTYLFILDQRHWKVEPVSIVSVKNAIRDVLFIVTMNVPQETSVT